MIKGLIFDLDGVITETAKLHYLAWKNEVAKLGINFTVEENVRLKGLPRLATLRSILALHGRELDFTNEELEAIAKRKNDAYKIMLAKDLSPSDILPGIKSLLEDAKQAKLKLAIASSSLNAPIILQKIGLLEMFDFIVDPNEIKRGKPAPDIFLAACYGVGLQPDEVVGFEDALPGVIGLKDAHIKAVAITHGDEGDWFQADLVFNSTNELNLMQIINHFNT